MWAEQIQILFPLWKNSNVKWCFTVLLLQGPHFPERLEGPEDINKLQLVVDVDKELSYVFSAITLTRHSLEGKVPLIGFTGAPVCM